MLCLDEGLGWRSTEVVRAPNGCCELLLHGKARALAEEAGFIGFSLSMTHESEPLLGVAAGRVVVGERRRRKDALR